MAKHMLMMQDEFLRECIQFLEACECKCEKRLPVLFIIYLLILSSAATPGFGSTSSATEYSVYSLHRQYLFLYV